MRAMRPVLSSPDRAQVLPASVDLYMPQPIEMCERMNGSPVPTQTTLGSLGATVTEPIDETTSWSNIGAQCTPPSVVFHRPPEAAPA